MNVVMTGSGEFVEIQERQKARLSAVRIWMICWPWLKRNRRTNGPAKGYNRRVEWLWKSCWPPAIRKKLELQELLDNPDTDFNPGGY